MIEDTFNRTEEKMKATVSGLKKDLASVRTGHASPSLIEHLKVDYAGVPTPLYHLAGISAPEARLLVIQPWDKNVTSGIAKAIQKSDLGLNPSVSGNLIRISIPPLSEERRQEMIKVVRKRLEERKVALRNLRHEAVNELRKLEKDKEISQDEHKRALERLQALIDTHTKDIEKIGRDKEAELMEV